MSTQQRSRTMLDAQGVQRLREDMLTSCGPRQLVGETFTLFVARVAAEYFVAIDVVFDELSQDDR